MHTSDKFITEWLCRGWWDYEYKYYTLMAHLARVDRLFSNYLLYPHLARLIESLEILQQLKKTKQQMDHSFPRRLVGVDLQRLTLLWERVYCGEPMMGEFDRIVDTGIEEISKRVTTGIALFDEVSNSMRLFREGLELDSNEGLLVVRLGRAAECFLYVWSVSVAMGGSERFHILSMRCMATVSVPLTMPYSWLRGHFASLAGKDLYCLYVAECSKPYPYTHTLLPVVKRLLLLEVASGRLKK